MNQPADENAASDPFKPGFDPTQANYERMQAVFSILREEADYAERSRTPRPAPPQSTQPAQPAPNENVFVSTPPGAESDRPQRRQSGLGVYLFFAFSLIVLAMGVVYGYRHALSEAFPQFAPSLEAYGEQVQQIKSGLRGFLSGGP